ncbi:MAG TPA: response regulator, partial [Verrucomicrobiaceae bacterium]
MAVRFLIVDDCNAHQKLMANLVSFLGGAMCYAENGREAMQLARSEEFDIILMDLQMPALDGISAADRLLDGWMYHPHRPRIVAVTGEGSQGTRALCRAVGM